MVGSRVMYPTTTTARRIAMCDHPACAAVRAIEESGVPVDVMPTFAAGMLFPAIAAAMDDAGVPVDDNVYNGFVIRHAITHDVFAVIGGDGTRWDIGPVPADVYAPIA